MDRAPNIVRKVSLNQDLESRYGKGSELDKKIKAVEEMYRLSSGTS